MRRALLLLLLACCAPCEPKACTVVANSPTRCSCGARFCTVCQCIGPTCDTGTPGEVVEFDCTTMQPRSMVCASRGGQ